MNTPHHPGRLSSGGTVTRGTAAATPPGALVRLDSKELFRAAREVEIAHEGRIYRLRLTQLNKLILTA